MRGLLTTQSQNFYSEQIQKEMLTRLAWKSRYAKLYPSGCRPRSSSGEPTQLPQLPADPQAVVPLVTRTTEKQGDLPPPPPPPPPPVRSVGGEQRLSVPPLMRPASPLTRKTLYQDSSHHGKGRSLYLQRRGHIKPEEKFNFPLLSSWEYGWRLGLPPQIHPSVYSQISNSSTGDYTLDYRTPSSARSSLVKNTFYARNGVFSRPAATDTLG